MSDILATKLIIFLGIEEHSLTPSSSFASSLSASSDLEYDPERFADQEVPILIVGTKQVSARS